MSSKTSQTLTKPSLLKLSLRVKLMFAIMAVLLFSIALNATLNYFNFEKRLTETSDSIYEIVLEETHNDINQAISLGLPLSAISNIQNMLDRRLQIVDGITALVVVSTSGEQLFGTGEGTQQSDRQLSLDITNSFGLVEGQVKLYYSTTLLEQQKTFLLKLQFLYSAIWILLSCLVAFVALKYLLEGIVGRVKSATAIFESAPGSDKLLPTITQAHKALHSPNSLSKFEKFKNKHFPVFIISLAILLTIIANLGVSYQSLDKFSQIYEIKLEQKSNLIGDSLNQMIKGLLDKGVPDDRLFGLEEEFAFFVDHHSEILSINFQGQSGTTYRYPEVYVEHPSIRESTFTLNNSHTIQLNVTTDNNLIINLLKESVMDMITVLVASCLVVAEIILFMCNFMIISPWNQVKRVFMLVNRDIVNHLAKISTRDEIGKLLNLTNQAITKLNPNQPSQDIDKQDFRFIRLPLFLLVFSEASSLAFFPTFVSSLENTTGWIPENLVTSLPISLFMLCWAISLPFAGYWSDKVGRRHSLMTGGLITCIGLVATAFIQSLELLLIARAFTAVGYGIVFISAQGYVSDTTNDSNRTKGMATFLSSFFSGSLCGAAIGGILAEKLGYSETFMLAGLLATLSVLLVYVFFEKSNSSNSSKPVKLQDFKLLLSNKYFALITVFSAIPAKIVLTGFLYYICPVYLQFLGESSSVSGRVIMAYGLAIILISPLSAILVDKLKNKMAFIFIGGLLSALALLNFYFFQGTLGLLLIVIIIGIAHGICVSPQIPLVIDLLSGQGIEKGKIIGIFRLTERIGNIAGPMLAGVSLSIFGYDQTIIIFGASLLVSSLSLIMFFSIFLKADKHKLGVQS
ncbi:Transporter [Vibrio chagasii]|uniref:MFS transporter n=1 Tax=Vibrio chagasii TaxID=170679 RepID=UPI001EFC5C60|nr:MFS transporter [Vibrio chagasii]MCG9560992.1 MFS transporter [Vibrio chagasii]CAH6867533.1 Transporter [Vibrio chagasii]CAH7123423.1 Transporter [Vibrio chagasii]CAH7139340.1 Transporter [Vibrio chagasii]CAH7417418.1 Transporter [Vibrio chagasii]